MRIIDSMISITTAHELARTLATQVRARRLRRGWSQAELAGRAGLKTPTYILFERTGRISLLRFLKILGTLDLLPEVERLAQAEDTFGMTLDELVRPQRQRGRRNRQ
jgi:transcriptional regulator with XRE-family HTH domain